MATATNGPSARNEGETGAPSEPNEHDYAHSTENNSASAAADGGVDPQESFAGSAQPAASLSVDLPGPAVGAEVDCTAGTEAEAASPPPLRVDEDPAKTAACKPPAAVPGESPRRGRRRPKRPEDSNCCCCKYVFERQGRGFNRRAVFTFTTPETVQWAFPGALAHKKSFLCETCAQVIRSKCRRRQTGKRSVWVRPPVTKQKADGRDKKKKGRRMGKKSKAALLVSKSCYKSAFKMLWSAKGARKPMMEFWSKQLKEEMKALSRQADSPFHEKVSSRKPLSSFPWARCLSWAQEKAPLVTACLRSLFPDINALAKSSHQLSEEQAQMLLERRTLVTLSVPLFTRNIWKNNFLQAALGAELRLQGCSGSALDALNTMGLCQNKDTVRLLLHRLRSGKKAPTQNGRQRVKIKQDHMKGDHITDFEDDEEVEDEEEDEEEVEDEEEDEEEEDDDDEEEDEEEVGVEDGVQEEEEDREVEEKEDMDKQRKKERKQRRERGKRKAKEREEEEDLEVDDEGSEQKKRRVVVVRLGLLKGHSEVGRSDLSAP